MGGTKPGQIAYIGETQFAPGEWAGIVLDEPIGMITIISVIFKMLCVIPWSNWRCLL